MGRLQNTITLAKQSWEVLKADKELVALPILSFLASALVAVTFIIPMFFVGEEPGLVGYVVMFLMYVALAFVTIFFNAALISAEVKAAVEKAKADIIAGAITVHNYEDDKTCPY